MVRPRKKRRIYCEPVSDFFKPRGIPLRELVQIKLSRVELEALRLADLEGMSHEEAAELMEVSRQTFGRIIQKGRQITANALVNGLAIKIEGGKFIMATRTFTCNSCKHSWTLDFGTGRPESCPQCGSTSILRTDELAGQGSARGQQQGRGNRQGQGKGMGGGRGSGRGQGQGKGSGRRNR